jgi:Lectin C-type domain
MKGNGDKVMSKIMHSCVLNRGVMLSRGTRRQPREGSKVQLWLGLALIGGTLSAAVGCAAGNESEPAPPSETPPPPVVPSGVLPSDPGVFDPSADGAGKGNGPNPNTVISANPVGCSGDGETFSGEHQSCYRLVSIPALTWAQASIDCTLWSAGSGHLVSVSNAQESEFLRNLVGGAQVWLGASDAKVEGTWVWLSGEAWTYQAFAIGRPDNVERSEHCSSMLNDGAWDDVKCESELPYVCERSFAQ